MITLYYESIDSYGKVTKRKFKTLHGAQKAAYQRVGASPTLGSYYAVSDDGVGKITVDGCTLAELFPLSADQHDWKKGA